MTANDRNHFFQTMANKQRKKKKLTFAVACHEGGDVLGEGAYGTVVASGDVCKKTMHYAGSDKALNRMIRRETLFLKTLKRCPTVVDCLHVTPTDFYMPKLELNLAQYAAMTASCADYLVNLYVSVILALGHMAEHEIVHMDIKPENVMVNVSHKCYFVLIDFGRAQWLDEQGVVSDQNPVPCGAYVCDSPENLNMVLRGLKKEPVSPHLFCDGRHDLYSLGLLLLFCIHGRYVNGTKESEQWCSDLAVVESVVRKINARAAMPTQEQFKIEKNALLIASKGASNETRLTALQRIVFDHLLQPLPGERNDVDWYLGTVEWYLQGL